jgi:hypothetical protein
MGKPAKVTVLMVRDPNTQLHRFGGVFTQKQHLWAALESLGVVGDDDAVIDAGDGLAKEANYRRLCEILRKAELGDMIVVRAAHDDKLAVFSEVEMNEIYQPIAREVNGDEEEEDE